MRMTAKMLVDVYRPGKKRKQGLFGVIIRKSPHETRSIEDRHDQSWWEFLASLHYFAGVLNMLPLLRVPAPTMVVTDANRLLVEGHELMRPGNTPSAALIRRYRKHEEKINRVIQKIEKAAAK